MANVRHAISFQETGITQTRTLGTQTAISDKHSGRTSRSGRRSVYELRFRKAAQWARQVLLRPDYYERYAALAKVRNEESAFNLAITDYLHAPGISTIDATGFSIYILAFDATGVQRVQVEIRTDTGETIESGEALREAGTPLLAQWVYVLRQRNGYPPGARAVVTASDLPGNNVIVPCLLGQVRSTLDE